MQALVHGRSERTPPESTAAWTKYARQTLARRSLSGAGTQTACPGSIQWRTTIKTNHSARPDQNDFTGCYRRLTHPGRGSSNCRMRSLKGDFVSLRLAYDNKDKALNQSTNQQWEKTENGQNRPAGARTVVSTSQFEFSFPGAKKGLPGTRG